MLPGLHTPASCRSLCRPPYQIITLRSVLNLRMAHSGQERTARHTIRRAITEFGNLRRDFHDLTHYHDRRGPDARLGSVVGDSIQCCGNFALRGQGTVGDNRYGTLRVTTVKH
jgi:hypothetical protein